MSKALKILIVGENSYIGRSFRRFAELAGKNYDVTAVGSRDGAWDSGGADFAQYDSILHCAGVAHVKQRGGMRQLYYGVNCDLAVSVAEKAINDGARQFIYLSSMSVYGGTGMTEITRALPPIAAHGDFYGGSKLKAEQELTKLISVISGADCPAKPIEPTKPIKLCILRPPMVYGKDCGGNFQRLAKLARIAPFFPDFPNRRSMIYIDNLCAFICSLIDGESEGVFLPQNSAYVCTSELVRLVAECHDRRVAMTKLFNPVLRLMLKRATVAGKLFGDLTYFGDGINYIDHVGFEDSVRRSLL